MAALKGCSARIGTIALALASQNAPAIAKTPGQTYCFHGICHRVLTVEETARAVGRTETVVASFYDDPKRDGSNPNIMTSSGERFDPSSDRTVASPVYPNGTRLLLWNEKTRAAAEVRVTNSGPYHGARRIDVSPLAAERLGFKPLGVSQLKVTVLGAPSHEEAKYLKGRRYSPVAGYLGVFANHERARVALAIRPAGPADVANSGRPVATPVHTGSVGWATNTQPVRPPLKRPASAAVPVAPAAAAPVAAREASTTARSPSVPAAAASALKPALAAQSPKPATGAAWPPAPGHATSPSDWAATLADTTAREPADVRRFPARALGVR